MVKFCKIPIPPTKIQYCQELVSSQILISLIKLGIDEHRTEKYIHDNWNKLTIEQEDNHGKITKWISHWF